MIDRNWHPLIDGNPPPWATGWGEDRRGVFTEFEFGKVTQRLRWIPPGRFLMGSPEDELERSVSEGPQREVTFAQGFWMFDTACTQGLWQAVMGENPSQFKGSDKLPVENVSFEDVQTFLEKINRSLPDLELTLPSEAQWEYACRAGTTTAFSFGENITTDQVNFDGNVPYQGAPKGAYREKTVEVGSLPPNDWGLYEMHGNVWEWCADGWHLSYAGAPTDGRPRSAGLASTRRVVRGGAWIESSLSARSAFRQFYTLSVLSSNLGFRCIRVQGSDGGGRVA